uniref:Uncharacterized protein n=1 Tax=Aegilops tauschii subsp. strangulata TaxID=200361 RepID=A0A453QF69_AEGTS
QRKRHRQLHQVQDNMSAQFVGDGCIGCECIEGFISSKTVDASRSGSAPPPCRLTSPAGRRCTTGKGREINPSPTVQTLTKPTHPRSIPYQIQATAAAAFKSPSPKPLDRSMRPPSPSIRRRRRRDPQP